MTNKKKTVVISGGMGGVGSAAAKKFAHNNYRVVVLYRNSSEEEIEVARQTLPEESIFMQCDIRNAQETAQVIDNIISNTGQIDVAVHAAVDPIRREKITDMSETSFKSQFEAGFFGAFNFLKPIGNIMKRQKQGTLVGITSSVIESATTPARMGAYTIGKIALRGLLRELHRELSMSSVRVIAVAPELMKTRLNADLPDKFFEIAKERSIDNSLMTTKEVANAIVQLCENTEFPSGMSYLVSSGEKTPI